MSSIKLYSCHPQCAAIRSLIEFLNTIVNNGMAFKRCISLLSGKFLLMWSCEAVEDLSGRTLSYSTNPIATRPQIQWTQFYKSNCHTDSNEIHSHYKTYSAAVSNHRAYNWSWGCPLNMSSQKVLVLNWIVWSNVKLLHSFAHFWMAIN